MRAAIDLKRGIMNHATLLPCAQPLVLSRGIQCQAMLHCMQQLIRARHHVPSDAAAMRAAIDSKRGVASQAILLPCAQPLILKRGIQCHAMLHCMQYLIRARHHVPSDAAAMRAANDSTRGITSQAILLPCAQPLTLKQGIPCQAMLHCMQQLIRAKHSPCASQCRRHACSH
jgi:hypothetical protein